MLVNGAGVRMVVNDFELDVAIVAYDGCHKIYVPTRGQESLFVQSFLENGWVWDEDFFEIKSAEELFAMYLNSCPLRLIQRVEYSVDSDNDDNSNNNAKFINIIPQSSFVSKDGFFNEKLARAAFRSVN